MPIPMTARLRVHTTASAPPSPAALLDVAEAAARLGTPVRFIRRLVAERRIRFYKVGRYVRFDPADLDRWLLGGRVEAQGRRGNRSSPSATSF